MKSAMGEEKPSFRQTESQIKDSQNRIMVFSQVRRPLPGGSLEFVTNGTKKWVIK